MRIYPLKNFAFSLFNDISDTIENQDGKRVNGLDKLPWRDYAWLLYSGKIAQNIVHPNVQYLKFYISIIESELFPNSNNSNYFFLSFSSRTRIPVLQIERMFRQK